MTTAAQIRDALLHPNVQAFLRIIRAGESNQSDTAYRILFGGDYFEAPPWRHPFHGITTTEAGHPTAAGAYQFLGTTFAELAALYPEDLADFSPQAQDFAAVADIDRRHTLQNVIDGDLRRALEKLKTEWVSLPGLGYQNAASIFQAYGGTLQGEQPAAPIEEQSVPAAPAISPPEAPMGAFLLPLIQTLVGAFTPAATQQLTSVLAKAGGDSTAAGAIVSNILSLVAGATGAKVETLAASPQAATRAISAVLSDADKLAQVEAAAVAHLNAIAPVLDKMAVYEKQAAELTVVSQDAAAARAGAVDLRPRLALAIWIGLALVMVVLGGAVLGQVILLDDHKPQSDILVTFFGVVTYLLARLGDVYGFAFGGVQTSAAPAAIQAAIAKK